MLYKKITTFFLDEGRNAQKEKKKNEKTGNLINQDALATKCRSHLHHKFTQKILQLILLKDELNSAKTLKLISLLP